jgi:SAM-dependent methyltransferase
MLARARRCLAPFEDRSRVSVALADARRLPYPGGTFDLEASRYFLHLLERENAVAALEEVRRVLRPGGRLVVVVHSAPATRFGGLYRRGWRVLERVLPLVGPGPLEDARPLLESVGFAFHTERRNGLGTGVRCSCVGGPEVRSRFPPAKPAGVPRGTCARDACPRPLKR